MVIAAIGIGKIEFFSLKENNIKILRTLIFLRSESPFRSKERLGTKADKNVIGRIGQRKRSFKSNESIKGWHFSSLKVRINSDRLNEIKVPKSSNTVSYHPSLSTSTTFFFSFEKFFYFSPNPDAGDPAKTNYTNGLHCAVCIIYRAQSADLA